MRKILGIFCAGNLGKELYDIAERVNRVENNWEKIIFVDDTYMEKSYYGVEVYRLSSFQNRRMEIEFIIANGTPANRKKIYDRLVAAGFCLTNLIDPTAIVSPTSKISAGLIVMAHSSISSDVQGEENILIQANIRVAHDIKIGRHSVLSSSAGIGGHVIIGSQNFIGIGAAVKENIRLGKNVVIGMGAVVVKDVDDNFVLAGNPAKVIRKNIDGKIFR